MDYLNQQSATGLTDSHGENTPKKLKCKVKGGGEAIEATPIQAQWWAKYAGGKE